MKNKLLVGASLALTSLVTFAQETAISIPAEATAAFDDIKEMSTVWANQAITWIGGIVVAVAVVFFMSQAVRWIKKTISAAS